MQKIKSLKVFFLAALFVMALSSVAFAGAQDFTLVNNTGADLYTVNLSPSTGYEWRDYVIGDILDSKILEYGESANVRFNTGGLREWDIQAVFYDGTSAWWYNIDLIASYTVTLNRDGTANME